VAGADAPGFGVAGADDDAGGVVGEVAVGVAVVGVAVAALGIDVTMFTPPEHAADLSRENARRVSVLADLAAAGPERLSTTMREHARLSRDAGTSA
jgi:hypothetical protein